MDGEVLVVKAAGRRAPKRLTERLLRPAPPSTTSCSTVYDELLRPPSRPAGRASRPATRQGPRPRCPARSRSRAARNRRPPGPDVEPEVLAPAPPGTGVRWPVSALVPCRTRARTLTPARGGLAPRRGDGAAGAREAPGAPCHPCRPSRQLLRQHAGAALWVSDPSASALAAGLTWRASSLTMIKGVGKQQPRVSPFSRVPERGHDVLTQSRKLREQIGVSTSAESDPLRPHAAIYFPPTTTAGTPPATALRGRERGAMSPFAILGYRRRKR